MSVEHPDQQALFGAEPAPERPQAWTPHARGSETSLRAAASVVPRAAKTVRAKVLDRLRACPSTDEELCDALGLGGNTVRPRRRDLETDGIVIDSGKRRPTRSGRLAVVWQLLPTTNNDNKDT